MDTFEKDGNYQGPKGDPTAPFAVLVIVVLSIEIGWFLQSWLVFLILLTGSFCLYALVPTVQTFFRASMKFVLAIIGIALFLAGLEFYYRVKRMLSLVDWLKAKTEEIYYSQTEDYPYIYTIKDAHMYLTPGGEAMEKLKAGSRIKLVDSLTGPTIKDVKWYKVKAGDDTPDRWIMVAVVKK